jgi:hypothetical protein
MRLTVRNLSAPAMDNVAVQIVIFPCQRTQLGVELTDSICVTSIVQKQVSTEIKKFYHYSLSIDNDRK